MMDPLPEYEGRRAAWLRREALFDRQFISLGNARLAVGIAAALLAWLAYGLSLLNAWWMLVPLAVFLVLAVWQERVVRNRAFAQRGLRYYDQALNRLRNQWQGNGETGDRFRNATHVYAEDLDLFGKGGLFELLSTARTAAGEEALAQWLLQSAPYGEAAARQQAVRELSARLDCGKTLRCSGKIFAHRFAPP